MICSESRFAECQLGKHFPLEMKQYKINAFGHFTKFWDVKQFSPARTRRSCAHSGSKDRKKVAIRLSGGLRVVLINLNLHFFYGNRGFLK